MQVGVQNPDPGIRPFRKGYRKIHGDGRLPGAALVGNNADDFPRLLCRLVTLPQNILKPLLLLEHLPQHGHQFGVVKRLDQVIFGAGQQRPLQILLLPLRTHDENRRFRRFHAQALDHVNGVAAPHIAIQQNDIQGQCSGQGDRFLAASGLSRHFNFRVGLHQFF